MSNNCLVCGSKQTGKKYLINKLISTDISLININDKQSKCTWNIVNKYYTSDVTLTIINDIKSISTLNDSDESKNDIEYQAIILVLNLSKPQVMCIINDVQYILHSTQ